MDEKLSKTIDEVNYKLEMIRVKQSILGHYEKNGEFPNKIYMTKDYYEKLSKSLNVYMVTSPDVKRIFDIPIEIVEDYKIK